MKKLIALLSFSILFSCTNTATQTPSTPSESTAPVTAVSFKEVKTLVDQKCTTCHTSVGRSPDAGVSFDTVNDIVSGSNEINRQVSRKRMPPSTPLSNTEMKLISDWVSQGAKTE